MRNKHQIWWDVGGDNSGAAGVVNGVKGIGRVSPMKSKSKVTGKSYSPKSRWIPMSEWSLKEPGDDIVLNLQPVSQYNPIIGEVIKESDKVPVVKEKPVYVIEKSTFVKESDKAPVVAAVVSEKSTVDEKDNPKVTSKSDKALVVAVVVSEKSVVDEKDNRKVTSKVSKVSDNRKVTSVKGISRVSSMKSKLKVTGKSNSPKSKWILMSKRSLKEPGDDIVLNRQPVSQYNPIIGEVIKESDKGPVVKEKPDDVIEKSTVVKESNKAPAVAVVVSEKSTVYEKDNPKVTSKVSKGKALDVLKYKPKTELPKDNQNDNPKCNTPKNHIQRSGIPNGVLLRNTQQ
ncbi:hypothetical protein Tco_0363346 [Tanacetum coccineum]